MQILLLSRSVSNLIASYNNSGLVFRPVRMMRARSQGEQDDLEDGLTNSQMQVEGAGRALLLYDHNKLRSNYAERRQTVKQSQQLTVGCVQGMSDSVWKVGCYRINPSTPSGQKFFILHMLVLPLIPITALVIQNSVTMNTLLGYQSRVSTIRRQVRGAMEIALFIQNLQEERAEVAMFIFTKATDDTELRINKRFILVFSLQMKIYQTCSFSMTIQERFSRTDRALEEGRDLDI